MGQPEFRPYFWLALAKPGKLARDFAACRELAPDHVSCYSLTIEQGTPFARRVAKGEMRPLSSDQEAELLHDAHDVLSDFGIERYEVSNYARPGFECRHNLNYWRGGDYLACGRGAHGHLNGHRWWNERATPHYVSSIEAVGTARAGEEHLERGATLG